MQQWSTLTRKFNLITIKDQISINPLTARNLNSCSLSINAGTCKKNLKDQTFPTIYPPKFNLSIITSDISISNTLTISISPSHGSTLKLETSWTNPRYKISQNTNVQWSSIATNVQTLTRVSRLAMPRSKKIGATCAKTRRNPRRTPILKFQRLGNVLLALFSAKSNDRIDSIDGESLRD